MLLVFALMPVGASAKLQDIRVLATGVDNSSYQASQKALDYARKRAVYLAARKLGVANAAELVAKFNDEQWRAIIRGSSVLQTRRVGEVTYAEVMVTIVDDALAHALRLPDAGKEKQVAAKTRGVMVLPVYVTPGRAYMWEKENQLRGPLADEIRRQAQSGIILPGGDYDDLRLIDYQNALTVKAEELKPMFERYGAEEIIIAILTPSQGGTLDPSTVLLRRLQLNASRNEVFEVAAENAEETAAMRLAKAVKAIAGAVTQITTSTAEKERLAREKATKQALTFTYTTPKNLADLQEAVRSSPQVIQLELPRIMLAQVVGTVYFNGDAEELRKHITKQGVIVRNVDGGWQLSSR